MWFVAGAMSMCRDPGNVSTSIIAQHTPMQGVYVGLSVILNSRLVAFARQREITGEPLNSRSRILAPNRREITGFDCIYIYIYIYIHISCKCDTNRAGHFTLDAHASIPVACLPLSLRQNSHELYLLYLVGYLLERPFKPYLLTDHWTSDHCDIYEKVMAWRRNATNH